MQENLIEMRMVQVPEPIWDAIVDVMGSAELEWPLDKTVKKVMQFIRQQTDLD